MVLFVLTAAGLGDLLEAMKPSSANLWTNYGVLDAAATARLRANGWAVTDFARWIDPADAMAVGMALDTIREHHPHEVVYMEAMHTEVLREGTTG